MWCFVFLEAKVAIGMNEFLKNIISLGRPDKRFWILIVLSDVFVNCGNQFGSASEDALL